MRLDYVGPLPEPVGFLLIPRFSMMAFFAAVEPLRIANRLADRELYRWTLISEDGQPVTASNGMTLLVDCAPVDAPSLPTLAVCAGFEPERDLSRRLAQWLHRLASEGCLLGGIDTGPLLLAESGLLDGHRLTLHWESLPAFRERFPALDAVESLFEIDARRFTCAGGAAAMDMTLNLIAQRHGQTLADDISEQLIHARLRPRQDQQRLPLARRLGTHKRPLVDAVALMERHLEQPLGIQALAERIGLSLRQLQRLFVTELGKRPRDYYLALRLDRARHLLEETDRDILSIGLGCGFGSASSFSRAYRQHFGHSPRGARRALAQDGKHGGQGNGE
ncbi:GlxA family transcriptional regulator [Salinicola rhizosphaerae]|uniref:AraC family transcriptional regulator n=1 Tax=Salinicola rhizosphaerae TaxID=1443141 RepID=A0ABQ3DTT9_9GAMM|nr:GlxA family transcriptional regulator [Salinicola rhizosphaerae]GHB16245.1 AraC family transcriptional regulator [Salinicola rhizosphaerae]